MVAKKAPKPAAATPKKAAPATKAKAKSPAKVAPVALLVERQEDINHTTTRLDFCLD